MSKENKKSLSSLLLFLIYIAISPFLSLLLSHASCYFHSFSISLSFTILISLILFSYFSLSLIFIFNLISSSYASCLLLLSPSPYLLSSSFLNHSFYCFLFFFFLVFSFFNIINYFCKFNIISLFFIICHTNLIAFSSSTSLINPSMLI